MALPSGRLLTYPRPQWRDVDVLDKDGKPTGEKRHELSFRRAHGRAKLWPGTLCENAMQAVAADLLRETVTRIETNPALAFMPIRMTTHDEIVCEVDEARADEAKAILRREMLTLPAWAAGLPLASEESVCRWYTKAKSRLRGSGIDSATRSSSVLPLEQHDCPLLLQRARRASRQYGARGITVDERWRGYPEGFNALRRRHGRAAFPCNDDRTDRQRGPYSPDNCIWADRRTQALNRRRTIWITVGDVTLCAARLGATTRRQHHGAEASRKSSVATRRRSSLHRWPRASAFIYHGKQPAGSPSTGNTDAPPLAAPCA